MKRETALALALAGVAVVAATALLTPGCTCGPGAAAKPTKIESINYHGWTNALRLTSAQAEVIVVPEVGRVMSFRLLAGQNVFWEDPSLFGQGGDPNAKEWMNFGGDKTWPAPEADWGKFTGRKEWMPPPVFDSMPVEAAVRDNAVVLTSPVDPYYGVRTVRRVSLAGTQLYITTSYQRVSGAPAKIGVWVITQFKDPVVVFVPMKTNSIFADDYFKFGKEPWPQLERKSNHIAITRDTKDPHKMGNDARRLLWVGEKETCVVRTWTDGNEYPDGGASVEVYTNPDPKKYVELEVLGPLSLMKPGAATSLSQSYLLHERLRPSPPLQPEGEFAWFFR